MKKNAIGKVVKFMILIIVLFCIIPFFIVLLRSIFTPESRFSLQAWYHVFLGTPGYLTRFWKSLWLCLCIVAGQTIVSVLAGYGFAKCRFPGKRIYFFLLMILMVMPLQVTLVPNYMILDRFHLLNTDASMVLPTIFIPLGTLIMTECFQTVSDEVIDAAILDGCGSLGVLLHVMLPMNKGGVVCVGLLSFLDAWNMVEQPIAYLKEFAKFPIPVALAYASSSDLTIQMVCCILVILPPLFLFLYFNRELVDGIVFGEKK